MRSNLQSVQGDTFRIESFANEFVCSCLLEILHCAWKSTLYIPKLSNIPTPLFDVLLLHGAELLNPVEISTK